MSSVYCIHMDLIGDLAATLFYSRSRRFSFVLEMLANVLYDIFFIDEMKGNLKYLS